MSVRKFYFVVWLLACLVGGTATSRAQQPEVLTLEQAIQLALHDNRQVKSAVLEVGKFDDRLAVARTKRLPEFKINALGSQLLSSIEFRFPQGTFGTYPNGAPNPATDTVIKTPRQPTFVMIGQVNQPLSQLYRIGLNLKQLDAGREIAAAQTRAQQQAVINNVKRVYYAILQTESSLHTSAETLKLYRELYRVTGEYVVQQVALKAEGLEVKTRLAKAEYEAAQLGDQLASQKEQLNQLLGRDVQTDFAVSAAPAFSRYEIDPAAARERALAERPELQEARLKRKQAEYDRRIKRMEYIPDVSLTLSYVSPQNINFVPRQIATAGVLVSWEPFDWGRKKRELAEKSRTIEQAEQAERETESAVIVEVNSQFRKLQQAQRLLAIGRLAEETAREQLRVASNRYTAQAALLKDVLHAQTALADANHQYNQALLAFWTARADFEKAIGGEK
ncbi:MAG TPA: TolC family protein [Blastocatellia bacterium]|nr:TolC family protein [Blastocatellia bacterium]